MKLFHTLTPPWRRYTDDQVPTYPHHYSLVEAPAPAPHMDMPILSTPEWPPYAKPFPCKTVSMHRCRPCRTHSHAPHTQVMHQIYLIENINHDSGPTSCRTPHAYAVLFMPQPWISLHPSFPMCSPVACPWKTCRTHSSAPLRQG